MQLRRYQCKEKGKGVPFGEAESVQTYDYEWLFCDDQIGLLPRPSTEAECFYGGFLGRNNTGLIVTRTPRLCIERADNSFGRIVQGSGRAGNGEEISRLIGLLTSEGGAHACLTAQPPYFAEILTFSRNAPSSERYTEVRPIPIEIRS